MDSKNQVLSVNSFSGMDLDSDDFTIPETKARIIRNMRFRAHGDSGVRVSVGGTRRVHNESGLQLEVLCSVEHIERNAIVSFMWSPDGYHHILLDSCDGSDAKIILMNTTGFSSPWIKGISLKFERTSRIYAQVIGDDLFWVSDNDVPRKLNIDKCIKTGLMEPGGYPYISESMISVSRIPPINPPKIHFETSSSLKGNRVRGKQYQFKYRYIYDDHTFSICSPPSKCAVPNDIYDFTGNLITDVYNNNVIVVSMYSGDANVLRVEVFARDAEGDWFLVGQIKNEAQNNLTQCFFRFTGMDAATAVDNKLINKQYDYVPDIANSLTLAGGKYMVYGGIVEGKDLPEPSVDFRVEQYPIADKSVEAGMSFETQFASFDFEFNTYNGVVTAQGEYIKIFGVNTGYAPGMFVTISISTKIGVDIIFSETLIYATGPSDSDQMTFRANLAAFIQGFANVTPCIGLAGGFSLFVTDIAGVIAPGYSTINEVVPDDEIWVFPNYGLSTSVYEPVSLLLSMNVGVSPSALSVSAPHPSVKSNASHRLGIVYTDKYGKISTVLKDSSFNVMVPSLSESNLPDVGNAIASRVRWFIGHRPPMYAYSYQFVYANSSAGNFFEFMLAPKTDTSEASIERTPDGMYCLVSLFAINNLKVPTPDGVTFPDMATSVGPYVFQEGDRIVFLTEKIDLNSTDQFPAKKLVSELVDIEVLGYEKQTDSEGIEKDTYRMKVRSFDFEALNIGIGTIAQIYTPNVSYGDNDVYYTIGESYAITNPESEDRAHAGPLSNQQFDSHGELVRAAEGVISKLGAYIIKRKIPFEYSRAEYHFNEDHSKLYFAESPHANDYFKSYYRDHGNINIYDSNAKSEYMNILRRSNAYFEGTNINGLCSFDYDDYVALPLSQGKITGLVEVGETLKVLMEKNQPSIYISANSLREAGLSGKTILAVTDNVFNNVNKSVTPYGMQRRCEFVLYNRNVYYFDLYNEAIVRDSANGPIDISALYNISSKIKEICAKIRVSEYSRVVFGVNTFAGDPEIWISFYAEAEGVVTLCETLVLETGGEGGFYLVDLNDEDKKTASAFVSMGSTSKMYSYLKGNLYQHEAEGEYDIYGSFKPPVVQFVVNKDKSTTKTFEAITEYSSHPFEAPEISVTPLNGPVQITKIFPSNIKVVEGVHYASVNRDVNSVIGGGLNAIYNGNLLRGLFGVFTLTSNLGSQKYKINMVVTRCIRSGKSF